MSFDNFNDGFTPQTGAAGGLDGIPDGDYDCTILTASLETTKRSGDDIVRAEIRFESLGIVGEKVWFFRNQENANRFGGDCATLGFSTGDWGKGIPLSKAIPDAVAQLSGKRFKGTKKQSISGGKTYHNLYVNAALPPSTDPDVLAAAANYNSAPAAADVTVPF